MEILWKPGVAFVVKGAVEIDGDRSRWLSSGVAEVRSSPLVSPSGTPNECWVLPSKCPLDSNPALPQSQLKYQFQLGACSSRRGRREDSLPAS